MATSNDVLGITSPVPMGDWQSTVLYKKLNIVKYNGTTYIAKKDNQNFQPETTSGWQEVWMSIADKGATGDKGQQGASIFHTMAASSTSIAISSLRPQLTPFVDDAVQFSNGDVRQITAVNGSTVTLGAVLFSLKGDPGIGNATLSNIDGDSTVDGFTQQFVKGGAQSKNYYNLGVYDTYVSNGDGTGVVTRQTYQALLDGKGKWSPYTTASGGTRWFYNLLNNGLPLAYGGDRIKNSRGLITADTNTHTYAIACSATDIMICLSGSETLEELKNNLALNPILVQFQLPTALTYTETVIDNQPIHIHNQDGNLWLSDEWRKGLNLISFADFTQSGNGVSIVGKDGKVSIKGTTTAVTDIHIPIKMLKAGTAYTFTVNFVTAMQVWLAKSIGDFTNRIRVDNNGKSVTFIVDYDITDLWIFFGAGKTVNATVTCMLNKGSNPYPYEPYQGGIVRENQVPLYTSTDSTSPAQLFGGDWESKGSYTTSDGTTIYVWGKL